MGAMPERAPAQPHAGVASAPAAASGTELSRTASLKSLRSPSAVFPELQQPVPPTLATPATPGGRSRFPWSLRSSRYGPSQVVPAPPEECLHPDGRRPLPAAQQRQQSAQATPSPGRSILSWVAVLGTRRYQAVQQHQRAAGSAAGQEELEAATLGASMCAAPFQPQAEVLERQQSPKAAARTGMAAASGGQDGDGSGIATPTLRGSR